MIRCSTNREKWILTPFASMPFWQEFHAPSVCSPATPTIGNPCLWIDSSVKPVTNKFYKFIKIQSSFKLFVEISAAAAAPSSEQLSAKYLWLLTYCPPQWHLADRRSKEGRCWNVNQQLKQKVVFWWIYQEASLTNCDYGNKTSK